ncbi:winged helix-turn-helix transcriptional regulator [Planomonospora sp. ID91781]|uniref:MarR family transcriptional regulator n=1 Tax=Planomonospora sphaerica TaxID=161355 RepID=A0A171DKB5_9ACTN|nr:MULTISPECIES: MarR family winged helix-turn-helix transcriptional regulator [Planomonospora]MBG0819792.1 winged helix-turn-helix transcriptional regulator [Planomonospora sp. ID91781]GAT69266.1 marR family transcriptional regulator [Planomonospora sphaerica]
MPVPERLGSHLKRAEQALTAAKHAALKPAGLTVPQYAALLHLAQNPGISAAALARACAVTPPTMNTVLKNLQESGLIERTPHEWHRNILETRLTAKGEEVLADGDARAVRVERGLAAEFTQEERETLIALLGRCTGFLQSERPSWHPGRRRP